MPRSRDSLCLFCCLLKPYFRSFKTTDDSQTSRYQTVAIFIIGSSRTRQIVSGHIVLQYQRDHLLNAYFFTTFTTHIAESFCAIAGGIFPRSAALPVFNAPAYRSPLTVTGVPPPGLSPKGPSLPYRRANPQLGPIPHGPGGPGRQLLARPRRPPLRCFSPIWAPLPPG